MSRKQLAGRRCLLWGLGAWLVISVGLLVRVQVTRPDLIAPDFAVRLQKLRQRQAEHPDRPLWLVVGSSRIRIGYCPEAVEPLGERQGRPVLVFNFAHNGMGPILQHLYLRRFLREGVRPALLVLEVMPMYLHHEPDHFLTRFVLAPEWPAAASYVSVPSLARNLARQQEEVYAAAGRSLFPGDLRQLVHEDSRSRVGRALELGGPGRLRDTITASDREQRLEVQRAAYRWRAAPVIAERAERALRDSLELCRREKFEVVLLLTPEGDSFRQLYPPGAEETIGAFVRRLGAETRTTVVDARRWLVEEDFFDGQHTLRRGTEKFTRRLHEEVLVPRVRGGRAACQAETAGPSSTAPQHRPAPTAAQTAGPRGGW